MRPLSVYVHIPFCVVKCGYCDFNAYAGLDALKTPYMEALAIEAEGYRRILAESNLVSVGFGGGTPGEVDPHPIANLVTSLKEASGAGDDIEVTLETNPGTTLASNIEALAAGGITRLSLGAQSFDPAELAFLDRIHSPEATIAAVGLARRAGIGSVNLDLIYGLPGHGLSRWRRTVSAALALHPDHLSLYALTVEPGTPLARRVEQGEVELPDEDALAALYEAASEWLAEEGFRQYELSNWAQPGHQSLHNLGYWTDREYIGLGAGAHGYVNGERYENIAHPAAYIEAVTSGQSGSLRPRPLSLATHMADWIMLRLRTIEGIAPGAFESRFGCALMDVAGPPLRDCIDAGVIEEVADAVRLTPRGRLLHGEVAARVLAHLSVASEPAAVVRPGAAD